MKIYNSKNAPNPVGPYSHATSSNKEIVFLSGQIALDKNGVLQNKNIETETIQVLENLKAVLNEAELTVADILKAEIFLTDLNDFEKVNEIYENFLNGHKPARVTISVPALPKNAKIEISLIAEKS